MSKVVSVIIPVFNTRADDLVRAIESVLQQTFPSFELLLVDDCGTSAETEAVLKRYREHPKVRWIRNPENVGVAGSRNRGISLAEGEWISFLDHDDYYKPQFLEKLMTGTKDSVDVVISGYENVDDNGRVLSLFPESDEEFEEERFVERNGMIWNRLFRRSALLEKGILFPEHRLMEDTVFCLRCAPLRSRTQVVPVREYCYYSSNSTSITHSKKNRMLSQEQLPFAELEQIIESGEYKRTIYYENTLLNAMMEVCCWLSTYSAAEVQQYAAEEAGKMFRRLNLSGEELSQILRAGDNSTFGRLLLRGYWFAAKHHKEQGFARLANRIIRLLRGQ